MSSSDYKRDIILMKPFLRGAYLFYLCDGEKVIYYDIEGQKKDLIEICGKN